MKMYQFNPDAREKLFHDTCQMSVAHIGVKGPKLSKCQSVCVSCPLTIKGIKTGTCVRWYHQIQNPF